MIIISIIIAFLCGSIPTGYLLIKKKLGIDIRTQGSGNIGSTNVKRIGGTKISIITQVIDVLKGVIPVLLGIYLSKVIIIKIDTNSYLALIAIAAILGHNYSPFLKFKGGKGVNTTLGAFVLIAPIPTFTGVAVYFILRVFTKIVSIRSIGIAITLPLMSIITKLPTPIIIATASAGILMILRHKQNIVRLINKEEK